MDKKYNTDVKNMFNWLAVYYPMLVEPKVDVNKVAQSQRVNFGNSSIDFKILVMSCAPFEFYLSQNMIK